MAQPPTAPPDQRRDAAARSAYYYQQQNHFQHQAPIGPTPVVPPSSASASGMTPVPPPSASTSTITTNTTTTPTSTAAARAQYHPAPPGAAPQQTQPHLQLQSHPTPPVPVSIVPQHQPVGGAPPHPSPLQHPPPPPPQQQQQQQQQRMPPPQQQRQLPRRQPPRQPGRGALQDDSLRSLMLRLDRQGQQLLDRVAPYKMYRWPKDRAALVARAISSTSSAADQGDQQQNQNASHPNGQQQQQKDEGSASDLPTTSFEGDEDEFRPFVRRLPEFKFWYSTTYATILAICATFVKAFDVPVFWPLLLFYFIMLFVATMRRQWLDMKRLKYVPWDIGTKKVYKSDPKSVSVSSQPQHPHAARNPSSSVATAAAGPAASVVNPSTRPPAPVPTIQVVKKPSGTSD